MFDRQPPLGLYPAPAPFAAAYLFHFHILGLIWVFGNNCVAYCVFIIPFIFILSAIVTTLTFAGVRD
jgi:hypothetical protein